MADEHVEGDPGQPAAAEGPHAIARTAAAPFRQIGLCWECAEAVSQALLAAGYACERLLLESHSVDPPGCFIVSNRVSDLTITENGRHYGVLVDGRVYDNLEPTGLELEAWRADFECAFELQLSRTPLLPGP